MLGWTELSFQSGSSVIMLMAQRFHDYVFLIMLLIFVLLVVVGLDILLNDSSLTTFSEYSSLEIWWTIVPGLILIAIAYPSLRLLYLMDEIETPFITATIIGHQWYWEYSLPSYSGTTMEAYMQKESVNQTRLLDVDNRLVLPSETLCRGLVSSTDVLHAWALPSLSVKVDAVPGRINQISMDSFITGVVYGQCSEVCGANHSFMPIVVEFIPLKYWVALFK